MTPALYRKYNLTARANRAARGQCAHGCGTKLPTGCPWRTCVDCRARERQRSRDEGATCTKVRRPLAERLEIYRRYYEKKQTTRELAIELDMTCKGLRSMVDKVRAYLRDLDAKPLGERVGPRGSPKQFPRCRCGLLLPCWSCVDMDAIASARRAA